MSFTADINRFTIKADRQTDKKVRAVCLSLLSQVVVGTPVDTGRARGNWQASINTPITSTVPDTDKSGGATISKGKGAVAQATGKVFYITNNLPYIYPLEFEGHSKQAPHGWVRAAVNRVASAIR